jgi:hypothetical protein
MKFRRSRTGRIDGYHLDAPSSWIAIPLPPSPEYADQLAAELSPTPELVHELAMHFKGVVAEATEDQHLGVALWIADPERPIAYALLVVDFVVPDQGEAFDVETLLEIARTSEAPAGVERLSRRVERVDLPAGPAVVQREIVAAAPGGEVEERIKYTVFPAGAVEALALAFAGPHLQLGERLDAEARIIAESLKVELA